MAVGKDIRNKIKSVQSTQKITRAMQMVAASKMRRVQQRMQATRPYAHRIHQVVEHLSQGHSEYRHPYLDSRAQKEVGIILISTNRGLCGGLNINLFRLVLAKMAALKKEGVKVSLSIIGSKAETFFKRIGAKILATAPPMGESPTPHDIIGSVQIMLKAYEDKAVDAVYLAHNSFVNTMLQKPTLSALLPVAFIEKETDAHALLKKRQDKWDYIYEPDAKGLLDLLLKRYIEAQVYQGVVENGACEQAARMIAMKSASDNAGELIHDLRLAYNKARQAAITQELSEIVSGAAAV